MKSSIRMTVLAAALAAVAGTAFAQDKKAAPPAAPAPAAAPAAPPAWKQGQPDSMKSSTLAPHAGKMTETAAGEIPLDKLKVPAGFKVEIWASGMPGVRHMVHGPQGKIYAGTRTIGRVYEITDAGDKRTSRVLVDKLTQPNGVAYKDGTLYVVAIDKVLRYDGIDKNANAQPVDLTDKFNMGKEQHHQWKFVSFGPDGKLYIPFGAPCNICEPPPGYAQIRRYNADGTGQEVVAVGVRNTVGFDWHPKTKELWFTDNGRDWAGDAKFDDELNRISKTGENFGFPYCHSTGTPDPTIKKDKACEGSTKPVISMGEHTAALGMKFYTGSMFPADYKDQAIIARRGSWNRTKLAGYDVIAVKAGADGKGAKISPLLTGFMDAKSNTFWGRPVAVLQMADGAILVADEQNGAIYRVSYAGKKAEPKKADDKGKAKA
jgi:glucose/arabinose dehydrogenase